MNYGIKNTPLLKKILWADTLLGGTTAIAGIGFFNTLTGILGLTTTFILSVSIITLCYSIVAFILANQKNISIRLLITLVIANWVWTGISAGLLFMHFDTATILGKAFLLLQVIVVGALAYLEGKQITAKKSRVEASI
jgi:hypothetical protein